MSGRTRDKAGRGSRPSFAQGWSRTRRVVVLRRRLPGTVALTRSDDGQGDLFWADAQPGTGVWEFAVLATSLDLEVRSVAQLYRDRADAENAFDELKNQWGWGGFTTRRTWRSRSSTTACSCAWRTPITTARRSPAGRFCFTLPARPTTPVPGCASTASGRGFAAELLPGVERSVKKYAASRGVWLGEFLVESRDYQGRRDARSTAAKGQDART